MALPAWALAALAVVAGMVVAWLALVVMLLVVQPGTGSVREALRLLPDLVRLVGRLAADRDLPRGVRVRLALLVAYLALPFDLVPDFLPVVGQADDVVIVVVVLRSVVRRAGIDALRRHWPGTDAGLAALRGLTGV